MLVYAITSYASLLLLSLVLNLDIIVGDAEM